jgi:hypothetical protein
MALSMPWKRIGPFACGRHSAEIRVSDLTYKGMIILLSGDNPSTVSNGDCCVEILLVFLSRAHNDVEMAASRHHC